MPHHAWNHEQICIYELHELPLHILPIIISPQISTISSNTKLMNSTIEIFCPITSPLGHHNVFYWWFHANRKLPETLQLYSDNLVFAIMQFIRQFIKQGRGSCVLGSWAESVKGGHWKNVQQDEWMFCTICQQGLTVCLSYLALLTHSTKIFYLISQGIIRLICSCYYQN